MVAYNLILVPHTFNYLLNISDGNLDKLSLLPDTKTCGKFSEDKIIGGQDADLGEFPWIALLEYDKSTRNAIFTVKYQNHTYTIKLQLMSIGGHAMAVL